MQTIKNLLGLDYPMFLGPMANITNGTFAAQLSNLGILGNIGSAAMDKAGLTQEVLAAKAITNRPFAVNLMLMNPHCDDLVDVIIEYGVKVVTTGAGNPGRYMDRLKTAGVVVIPVIPSVALAKRMESYGADALIAEGTEAGGHVGELTTMALLPQVSSAVNIPVIAAGGIATGQQIAAAFALGAQGVQCGTAFLVSEECPIHANYKQALVDARDIDTIVTGRIAGVPVRGLKNDMTLSYVTLEKQGKTREELEHYTLGALRKAVVDGDIVNGSVMTGQVSGLLKAVEPAQAIIERMFSEARDTLKKLQNVDI